MLIAISVLEKVFDMSLPLFIVELIGAGFIVFGFVNFFRHNNVKSQLAAKDAVIATNQQTINSIEDRLKAVEDQLADVEAKLDSAENKNESLTAELRDWEQKYKSLENFAAPQLGRQLFEMFSQQEQVLNRIVGLLDSIEKRMDAIEKGSSHK